MAGVDIPIPELQLTVHPPTIKDIAYMGESDYFSAVQYLCLDKEQLVQDKFLLSSLSNFQVLMKVLESSENKEKKQSVLTLLKLLFPDYSAMITKNSIILAVIGDTTTQLIDDNNFDIFQAVLKEILCVNSMFQGENVIYNPANAKAQAIADKLMAGRRKVAAIKSSGGGESVLTRYLSIITVGLQSMPLSEAVKLNMFQLFDIMERYSAFVEWDTDLRVRLAGGKPDRQVESWMRDIHPKDSVQHNTQSQPIASSEGASFGRDGWVNK